MGPVQPVGIPADEMARARAGKLGLATAIQAALGLAHQPDAVSRPVLESVNRLNAPSQAHTTADVFVTNLMAALAPRLAESGTQGAVDRRGYAPDATLSDEADGYGLAASSGALAGALGLGRMGPEVPMPKGAPPAFAPNPDAPITGMPVTNPLEYFRPPQPYVNRQPVVLTPAFWQNASSSLYDALPTKEAAAVLPFLGPAMRGRPSTK